MKTDLLINKLAFYLKSPSQVVTKKLIDTDKIDTFVYDIKIKEVSIGKIDHSLDEVYVIEYDLVKNEIGNLLDEATERLEIGL